MLAFNETLNIKSKPANVGDIVCGEKPKGLLNLL